MERNCLNVNQKWIFPELKQQFKNCKQSERVFLYTSDTEYLNDEYFKDENYLYYRDGVLKYKTIIGSTNSVPAFKRSNYRIDELYYKKYLNNRKINCD